MALNSINTNIAAMAAQANIGKASSMAGSSISRLSSGNRITRASDDVAAMSAGTSLRTSVTTLKMALINTSQGSSLLQVADGALSQITDILQRQKSIAVQAGSGSLTSQERTFLNQEFQNLTQEVDRLSKQTNFNGVQLLDGVLTKSVGAVDNKANATKASSSISFTLNATAGQTAILNGVTLTSIAPGTPTAAQFVVGGTVAETVTNLATQLNASTDVRLSGHTYAADGNTLRITAKSGGLGGSDFVIDGAGTWTAVANAAAFNAPDSGSYINVFATGLGVANANTNVISGTGTPAATEATSTPIGVGTTMSVQIGAGANLLVYTAVAGHSLNDVVNTINASTNNHGITALLTGSSGNYNIQLISRNPELNASTTGDIAPTGTFITASRDAAGALYTAPTSTTTAHIRSTGLSSTGTTGIRSGDTVGIGNIGNNLVTDQNQSRSVSRIIFPPITPANLQTTLAPTTATPITIQIGDTATANERVDFSFTRNTVAGAASTEISIGATLEETIDNAASAINKFVGNGFQNYSLNQVRAYRDGQSLVIETIDYGTTNRLDLVTGPVGVALTNAGTSGVTATSTTLNNGTRGGISASNVTNAAFVGKISGFQATHTGTADTVNVSLTVGSHTYTANSVDTTATQPTTLRLSSENGGYLDIELRANSGTAVASQADANSFASRLDAAFATVDFYQTRDISSYKGSAPVVTEGLVTGSLAGTTVRMAGTEFTDLKIENISVTAPVGSSVNATVEFTVNGEKFSAASPLSKQLGANQTYKLVSAGDGNRFIEFTTGDTAIQLDTTAKATAFEDALNNAFGVGTSNAALSFQVGVTSGDALSISLNGVTTKDIGIESLDVLTQASASVAADTLDSAIDKVTAVRAEVGALQSRFNFAAANVESSISNQDSARGVLLDTDIAAESTAFSTAQVQLQAGISVLAQANQLQQNLLKLIG
jgi:flagellin